METRKDPQPPPEQKASGPIYRLRVDHVLPDQRVVPAGTLVGADQPIPWEGEPTNNMEGVNDAGRNEVNKVHQRLYDRDAPWHDPAVVQNAEEDLKTQERQRQEAERAHPVSHQQAVEQDKEWKGPVDPVVQARIAGTPVPAAPTIGGQLAGPGVPAPKTEPERPTKPLEEQLPKS